MKGLTKIMDELKIKQNIAKNIAALRTRDRLTQAELAEKLNYSDKAISKWERAESIPDVTVLKRIADMFGVTVDYIISDATETEIPKSNASKKNRDLISGVSVAGVWVLATIVFAIIWIISGSLRNAWLVFPAAFPVSSILLIVFNSIWGSRKRFFNQIYVSLLVWSILVFVYLAVLMLAGQNLWAIFFIGIPAEAVVFLGHKIGAK